MNRDHIKWAVFGGLILISFFCLSSTPENAVPVGVVAVALAEGGRRRKKAQEKAITSARQAREDEQTASEEAIDETRESARERAQKWLDS